jgi:Zn-dependent protease
VEQVGPSVQKIVLWAVPILVAVVLHELAHGYVAFRLGDPTAARLGRLTLNPLAHVDMFGTVILPFLLLFTNAPFVFGYAKPVPINVFNLHNPRRDMALVALAGPLMNLFLAGILALVFKLLLSLQSSAGGFGTNTLALFTVMAMYGVLMNVALAVLNLFPLPPLDGGRIAAGLLPRQPAIALARLEPYGILILLVLMMTGLLDRVLDPVRVFLLKTLL